MTKSEAKKQYNSLSMKVWILPYKKLKHSEENKMIRTDCQKKYIGSCMKAKLEKSQITGRETKKKLPWNYSEKPWQSDPGQWDKILEVKVKVKSTELRVQTDVRNLSK